MEALGRLFDIGTGWAPVDLDTADGATGKRVALSGANAITFVVFAAAGAATAATYSLQQHTAYTSGDSADLVACDHYYIKSETTLDNDESWVRVDQTEDEDIVLPTTDGDNQYILVIEVDASQLSDGYTHVSLDVAATLSAAKIGACLYFLHELRYQRAPARLRNLLNPPAANV